MIYNFIIILPIPGNGINKVDKVPDNLSYFSRHDLAYFVARSSIFIWCDSPVGIQIKIQIGQISTLASNLKLEKVLCIVHLVIGPIIVS